MMQRCAWAGTELSIAYHDHEWGTPQHDDRTLFEFVVLEGMQAGLSWETILRKRDNFRRAFDGFDPARVARYGARKRAALLKDAGIIRNRMKIEAAVENARAFLRVQREHGSFDAYLWSFAGGRPLQNAWACLKDIPPRTPEADLLSRDLVRRGFRFVGPTICYALMQAVGMVNDHTPDCFRYRPLGGRGQAPAPLEALRFRLSAASGGLPAVTHRRMFGCHALFAGGQIFALVWTEGRLGVKLPGEAGRHLAAARALPGADPWIVKGKAIADWVLLPDRLHDDTRQLEKWVHLAHALAL